MHYSNGSLQKALIDPRAGIQKPNFYVQAASGVLHSNASVQISPASVHLISSVLQLPSIQKLPALRHTNSSSVPQKLLKSLSNIRPCYKHVMQLAFGLVLSSII